MHVLFWIIILITCIVFIWILEYYYRIFGKFRARVLELELKFSWYAQFALYFWLFAFSIGLYIFYVHYLTADWLILAMLSIYTIVNVIAWGLSYFYFNATHCFDDEGNPIARKMFKEVGEDIGHTVMGILRLLLNILLVWALLTEFLVLDLTSEISATAKIFLTPLIFAISTAIYSVELGANIWAVSNIPDIPCGDVHRLCAEYGIMCDDPMIEKKEI